MRLAVRLIITVAAIVAICQVVESLALAKTGRWLVWVVGIAEIAAIGNNIAYYSGKYAPSRALLLG